MIREVADKMGVSVSELVRQFFRALATQSNIIQVNQRTTNIQIGALTINIVQQQQVNNNIVNIKIELEEALRYIEAGLQSQNYTKMYSALKLSRDILKKVIKSL